MQQNKVKVLCQGIAACALWVCGLQLLQSAALAQTSPDTQAEKTIARKAKKSATDATAPAADEMTSKGKKAKKAAAGETSTQPAAASEEKASKARKKSAAGTGSANRAETGGDKEAGPAPVRNASGAEISSAKTSGKVWVNTESGVYHKGGRWYGATKQGKFMTEQEATKAGYRAAKNEK